MEKIAKFLISSKTVKVNRKEVNDKKLTKLLREEMDRMGSAWIFSVNIHDKSIVIKTGVGPSSKKAIKEAFENLNIEGFNLKSIDFEKGTDEHLYIVNKL